jgi:hypothetical protein
MYISFLIRQLKKLKATDHTHANKSLLDTYNQTNANLTEVVNQKLTYEEIGEINYTDLNSGTFDATEFNFVFSNKKTINKYLVGLFFKNIDEFTSNSYGYTYETNSIENIYLMNNTINDSIGDSGTFDPAKKVDNITVGLILEKANKKNWLTGQIKVYAVLRNYPTLT